MKTGLVEDNTLTKRAIRQLQEENEQDFLQYRIKAKIQVLQELLEEK